MGSCSGAPMPSSLRLMKKWTGRILSTFYLRALAKLIASWRPRQDSNPQPSDPKSDALSIELLGRRLSGEENFTTERQVCQRGDCLLPLAESNGKETVFGDVFEEFAP